MEMDWIGYLLAGGIVYASLGLIGISLLACVECVYAPERRYLKRREK